MVLEKKLMSKNLPYETISDESIMREKGFASSPILEVDNKVMAFEEANNWINSI